MGGARVMPEASGCGVVVYKEIKEFREFSELREL